jgi:hypothetical protein
MDDARLRCGGCSLSGKAAFGGLNIAIEKEL